MPHNGFQLELVRFETDVYRKTTNKDRMFVGICNAKINVLREAIAIANACAPVLSVVEVSARITGNCCYA